MVSSQRVTFTRSLGKAGPCTKRVLRPQSATGQLSARLTSINCSSRYTAHYSVITSQLGTMFGLFGAGLGGNRTFEQNYRAMPVAFIDKPQAEDGDKIFLPPSALHVLGKHSQAMPKGASLVPAPNCSRFSQCQRVCARWAASSHCYSHSPLVTAARRLADRSAVASSATAVAADISHRAHR